ncbi:V-type ATP synthase subunit F [Candidatus Albibeggiatoa sp. nov. BB20]|uniref:V-type ATP synthase subunit F n=1 Tax=Candidatus Albibeggiatoa sp. nov. BB20 TaxID=3162723 RepID=UPI0033659D12
MRLIFMGSEALADGFALLGFEIFTNAVQDDVEQLLIELLKHKRKALIFLEDNLTKSPKEAFLRARNEAAGIIITEIPALNAPETYRPMVEDLVVRVLGASVLDKT